jgi:hypothetical protein
LDCELLFHEYEMGRAIKYRVRVCNLEVTTSEVSGFIRN